MQLYNINTSKNINIISEFQDYIINSSRTLYCNIESVLTNFKSKTIKIVKELILLVTLFVLVGVPLLLEGVSTVDEVVVFNPDLVVLPALEALLSSIGLYFIVSIIPKALKK